MLHSLQTLTKRRYGHLRSLVVDYHLLNNYILLEVHKDLVLQSAYNRLTTWRLKVTKLTKASLNDTMRILYMAHEGSRNEHFGHSRELLPSFTMNQK